MADTNQSTQDRLRTLDAQLELLEHVTAPPPPPRHAKLPRIEPSPRERGVRRWLFWAIQGWCALIFILAVVQGAGTTPIWQWPLVAAFASACGWGIYGFCLFYWEMGKGAVRWTRRRFRSGSSEGDT